jgi:hypothetical protein
MALRLKVMGLFASLLYRSNRLLLFPVNVGVKLMAKVVEPFGATAAEVIGMPTLYCENDAVSSCTKLKEFKFASPLFLMVKIC